MKQESKPTVGRIVHYVLEYGPNAGRHRPAVVVATAEEYGWSYPAEDQVVQLQVFVDGSNDRGSNDRVTAVYQGCVWRSSVKHDEQKRSGTWHWPEREEAGSKADEKPASVGAVVEAVGLFRSRAALVEVMTFQEFVEYGKVHGGNIVNGGAPWSFTWRGRSVTHENDSLYLISLGNGDMVRFARGDMLIADNNGRVFTCSPNTLASVYEPVREMKNVGIDFGHVAYDAYTNASGGKSLVSGCPLPGWNELSPAIRDAWQAAAKAVRQAAIAT